jgi:hypothetical protein
VNAGAARAIARRCAIEPEDASVWNTTVETADAPSTGWAASLFADLRRRTAQRPTEGTR